MSAFPARRVAFGTTQERWVLPPRYPPDRLGNQLLRQEAPHLGPGCYNTHAFGTIVRELESKPGSKRGFGMSARTAARFPHVSKTVTPLPHQYQPDQSRLRIPPPNKTPFNSSAQRFKSFPREAEACPGPGTYDPDTVTNRKVCWPMCFGRPDWTRLPQLEKKSLRVKLASEIEFVKQRNRMAYLSLYF